MLSEISARMAAIVRLLAKPRLLTTNSLPSTVQTRLPSAGRSSLRTGSACCVRRVSDGRTSRNRDCSVWPFTRFFNPRKKTRLFSMALYQINYTNYWLSSRDAEPWTFESAPDPAPAPSKMAIRLRLRLPLRAKYDGSGGSGSPPAMRTGALRKHLSWGILGLGRITLSVLTFLAVSYLQEPKIKIVIKKMNLTV